MVLLNPKKHSRPYPDELSREVMLKTIDFFERKGKARIKEDYHARVWYADFLDFVKEEKIFATMCTPAGNGAPDSRWDTWRVCEFAEILGFYGLQYWYTWQVTVLGLGPIWMSDNEPLKQRAAEALEQGGIFAFGLSEKEHGADVYSTDMILTPRGDGTYTAKGGKYYIGNGNKAAIVSTFGKFADSDDYVFFAADSQHDRYHLIKNVCASQNYVAQFELDDYPVAETDILARGEHAWNSALNTVNIGKYNLGWASIGMCTHALYEAIHHASNRRLYNMHVTDFPHVKQMFTDAYARLTAMKLFALRAADYMRVASPEDRRYLLYNPMVKMKVTTQGEDVMNLLWDVIAAKGFEGDMFFEQAAVDIRALPKLEGTVHVNIALIVKFMANYFFAPADYPEVAQQNQAANDDFLLMLFTAPPDDAQQKDIDFLLAGGEIFALVVYGQLILENANIYDVADDVVDQIFDFMVRDFSRHALNLYSKPSSSETQMACCLKMIRKPVLDEARYQRVWQQVHGLQDAYEMAP
jgi:acyl-CoA dehydrogenase